MSTALRISGCVPESIVDGPGIRFVLFVQGCPHACPGCHNMHTHDFAGGYEADMETILSAIRQNPLISGITFSGGEPFCQAGALCELGERIREMGKPILIYSGYTFEQLVGMSEEDPDILRLMQLASILVDGRYIEQKRDLSLRFRGSSNQRIIDLPLSLGTGKPVLANI